MPLDNMQNFENLCHDALVLQQMADSESDTDAIETINSLTGHLRLNDLKGSPVGIMGGLVEVQAIDEDQDTINTFVGSHDGISGQYEGLSWRRGFFESLDGTSEACWMICHVISNEASSYIDENGDRIERTPLTYVTVDGSDVDIISYRGSHDYRKIALDGICHEFDRVSLDESLDVSSKADTIAKIVRKENVSDMSYVHGTVARQRISYLNELGIFENTLVVSPLAIRRSGDDVQILKAVGHEHLAAKVDYVALDQGVDLDGNWIDQTHVLSYEVELDGFGHVSVPHVPGMTRVYDLF